MSGTGLPIFDTTISKTNAWLHEIMTALGTTDKRRAYAALRAVLHVLRDRLPAGEAVALGAQLPTLVRGLYYEGWQPDAERVRLHRSDEFIMQVEAALGPRSAVAPKSATHAVLGVLDRHLSTGETAHVQALLPRHLAELWS